MTDCTEVYSVVAVYDSHVGAESAIQVLNKAGLDLRRLSICGKGIETEDHALGFYARAERLKDQVWRGAAWGTLWGLLFGGAFFFTSAIGPLTSTRSFVSWIVWTLEATVVGASAGVIASTFTSIGLYKHVVKYEHAEKGGEFAVIVRGTSEIFVHARAVLGTIDPSCTGELSLPCKFFAQAPNESAVAQGKRRTPLVFRTPQTNRRPVVN